MNAERPIVELREATRRYGAGATSVIALDSLSCAVMPGERIAITGPSGSGKTTLLSLLGLIDAADAGDVLFTGASVMHLSEDARAELRRSHVGFVFQLFHLIPALTALDNVTIPLVPYAPRQAVEAKARSLLERIGLGDRVNHRPGQLSGGEQQRVAIARALVNDPEIVLADEPTGNLDSRTSDQVLELLLALQGELRFALVVATHDPGLTRRMDRAISLFDGRLDGMRSVLQDTPRREDTTDGQE